MSKEFIDGKWYVAYAVHKWADIEDIDSDYPFDTEEEAIERANDLRCDDDNARCYFRKDGRWFKWELVEEGEPVVHAHWEKVYGYVTPGGDPVWACSNCGKGVHIFGAEAMTYNRDISDNHQWVSCPNCGAKMDGEK